MSGQNKIPFTCSCLDGAEPFETDNSETWRNTTKATWLQSTAGERKQQWWENTFLTELITMPLSQLFKSIPEVSADSKKVNIPLAAFIQRTARPFDGVISVPSKLH